MNARKRFGVDDVQCPDDLVPQKLSPPFMITTWLFSMASRMACRLSQMGSAFLCALLPVSSFTLEGGGGTCGTPE